MMVIMNMDVQFGYKRQTKASIQFADFHALVKWLMIPANYLHIQKINRIEER